MPLSFNTVLTSAGFNPATVLLLRHQASASGGRSRYRLWRDQRPAFEDYQRRQPPSSRYRFDRPYWASFVAAPGGATLFVGLYAVGDKRLSETEWVEPLSGKRHAPGAHHIFDCRLNDALSDFIGLLTVDWGDSARSWVQNADRQDKRILELRLRLEDPPFPGHAAFIAQLSEIESLPPPWASALAASRGIYLLSCPRTNEQYVGAALGADGFLGRWLDYARSGHGGNVGLRSREPSDYRVSILETAGSGASVEDILAMEARWKAKLQSREMGLNHN